MEVFSGTSNWKLKISRTDHSVTILRAFTCDASASLPDELFDLPITELGPHALAPSAREVPGEEVWITCGAPEGDFDNRNLRELSLPAPLQKIGSYAFMNCCSLEALHLSGELSVLGADAFMNCRSFSRIFLFCEQLVSCRALAFLVEELPQELSATIFEAGSAEEIRLLFPEYREVMDENVPNHYFNYVIAGAGYPYHNLFQKKLFSLSGYDALWEKFLSCEYERASAIRLAWWRIRYPAALSEEARSAYLDYLRPHFSSLVRLILEEERDIPGLRLLLALLSPSREDFAEAQQLARNLNFTEASAILLEEQHRRFPIGHARSFEL